MLRSGCLSAAANPHCLTVSTRQTKAFMFGGMVQLHMTEAEVARDFHAVLRGCAKVRTS